MEITDLLIWLEESCHFDLGRVPAQKLPSVEGDASVLEPYIKTYWRDPLTRNNGSTNPVKCRVFK